MKTPAVKIPIRLILVASFFLILSIVVSYGALTSGGRFTYRDEWTIYDMSTFKEYLFQIARQSYVDLDFFKRIPELWIHLFMDYELYDRIKFTLIALSTLTTSFFVFNRILGSSKLKEDWRLAASVAGAVFYLINPINTQLFISYYPSLVYAAFPLFFYFLYEGLVESKPRSTALSGLIASFMFLMVVHSFLYILIAFIALLPIALCGRGPPLSIAERLSKHLFIFALVCFSATAFVMLPSYVVSQTTALQNPNMLSTQMLDMFSGVSQMPRPLIMDYHVFWWPYVDYKYPFGDMFYLIAPIICASLLLWGIYDRNAFSVASIIALAMLFFFIKGDNPPFSLIYGGLNFGVSLGWLIRVPMKFAHILPFFFSLLFIRSLAWSGQRNRSLFICSLIIIPVFFAVFSWPFFTGDMGGVLHKTDYSARVADVEAMDAITAGSNSTALIYGVEDSMARFDMVGFDGLMARELDKYRTIGNWSGLDSLSGLGVDYLIVPPKDIANASRYLTPIYNGTTSSLLEVDGEAENILVANPAYLSYADYEATGSVMIDPPDGHAPGALFMPYLKTDFPESYLSGVRYVVLGPDSSMFPSIDSRSAATFFQSTLNDNSEKGWARLAMYRFPTNKTLYSWPDLSAGFAGISGDGRNFSNPIISSHFDVDEDAGYDVYLRVLRNRDGGNMLAAIDGKPAMDLNEYGLTPYMKWERIFSGRLGKGGHDISITQINGSNYVSIAYAVRSDSKPADLSDKTIIYRMLGWIDFYSSNASVEQSASSSVRSVLKLRKPASCDIEIAYPGDYGITVSGTGRMMLMVDGKQSNGTVYLSKGMHLMDVVPLNDTPVLSYVTLVRNGSGQDITRDARVIEYSRSDASHYSGTVESSGPFYLILSRAFDPQWVLSMNGKTYLPVSSFDSVNAYYLNETGTNRFSIEYAPQDFFHIGAVLGAIGLCVAFVLVWRWPG